jgi:hypothetical protein
LASSRSTGGAGLRARWPGDFMVFAKNGLGATAFVTKL